MPYLSHSYSSRLDVTTSRVEIVRNAIVELLSNELGHLARPRGGGSFKDGEDGGNGFHIGQTNRRHVPNKPTLYRAIVDPERNILHVEPLLRVFWGWEVECWEMCSGVAWGGVGYKDSLFGVASWGVRNLGIQRRRTCDTQWVQLFMDALKST